MGRVLDEKTLCSLLFTGIVVVLLIWGLLLARAGRIEPVIRASYTGAADEFEMETEMAEPEGQLLQMAY